MNEFISVIPDGRAVGVAIVFIAIVINLVYTVICLIKKKPLSPWRIFNNFSGIGSILYSFIIFGAIVFQDLNQLLDLSIVYGFSGFSMFMVGLMSFGVKFNNIDNSSNNKNT